jgi:DNA-binding XRE family transcriptional regulator
MSDEPKETSLTSICLVLLREVRMEQGYRQAYLASWVGKTTGTWTKIEAGTNPLQLNVLFHICTCMRITPSHVLATAERYAVVLSQNGWSILTSHLPSKKDSLLRLAQQYWALPARSRGLTSRRGSVLDGPLYGGNPHEVPLPAVFRFALDPVYRAASLDGVPVPHLDPAGHMQLPGKTPLHASAA